MYLGSKHKHYGLVLTFQLDLKPMSNKKTVLWSHVFFVAPLTLALAHQLYLYSAIIIITVVVSYKYHLHPRSQWHFLDHITAPLLIASNFYLFHLTTFASAYFVIAISLAAIAFIFFFKASKQEYYHYHALWHLLSAAITVLSVLGYINY